MDTMQEYLAHMEINYDWSGYTVEMLKELMERDIKRAIEKEDYERCNYIKNKAIEKRITLII